jgi:hypothetical protein
MTKKQINPKEMYKYNIPILIGIINKQTGWCNNDDFIFSWDDEKQSITIISKIIPEVTCVEENFSYPCDKLILAKFVEEFLVKYIKATFKGQEPKQTEIEVLLNNFRFMFGNE